MATTVLNFRKNFTKKPDAVHYIHEQLIGFALAHALLTFVEAQLFYSRMKTTPVSLILM
jgi:hypothetical protein